MKVSELKSKPPKILIYGPPGTGKTALVQTLGARGHLIDLDDNLEVGLGLKDNLREERMKIDVAQFLNDNPKKPTAFSECKKHVLSIVNKCSKGDFPFQAVAIDSLSSLASASQDETMYAAGRVGQNPEIQHWGTLLNEIERVITYLRSLPLPVFYIAHETTFTADDINRVQIAIPG